MPWADVAKGWGIGKGKPVWLKDRRWGGEVYWAWLTDEGFWMVGGWLG